MTYVDMLIRTKFGKRAVTPKDIGIVTPFKQQQLDISHHLAAMNLENITVGTVETFQGQERNVMILSTVRSKIFKHNDKEHIGFLSNYKVCYSVYKSYTHTCILIKTICNVFFFF